MPCDRQTAVSALQSTQVQVQVQSEHEHDLELNCPECGARLARKFDLRRHMLTHAKELDSLKFHCPFEGCKTKCLQKANMLTHMKRHTGLKDIKCPHEGCTWITGDPACLTRHRKSQHGYVPAARAPRHKSPKTGRFQPYGRVALASDLQKTLTPDQEMLSHIIPGRLAYPEDDWSVSPLSSHSSDVSSDLEARKLSLLLLRGSSISPLSISTSPESSSSPPASSSSASTPLSSSGSDGSSSSPASKQAPSVFQPPIFGMDSMYPHSYNAASTLSSSSSISDTEFEQLLASIGTEEFMASLQELPALPALPALPSASQSTTLSPSLFLDNTPAPISVWQPSENEWTKVFSVPSPTDSVFSEAHTPAADLPGTSLFFNPAAQSFDSDFSLDFTETYV